MMRAERLADILPDALVAQVHAEGDAVIGQQQQVWFVMCKLPCSKHFSREDFADQCLAILWVLLPLEVITKLCYLLWLHI